MVKRVLSIEDGNIGSASVAGSRNVDYVDVSLDLLDRPSGDVYKKSDAAAVKQSVKNLLLTGFYEKPFNPFFGAGVHDLLFELADDLTSFEIEDRIKTAIQSFEPRAEVVRIVSNVRLDNNSVDVEIVFRVVNTEEEVTLTTTLSRLR